MKDRVYSEFPQLEQITNQFSRMDFKHKTPPPNGNYPDTNIYRSPYNNESMLHHINSIPKSEHYQQHMSVYDYNNSNSQHKNIQNMFANRHYHHRSPSVRLRRRCRSECLSPIRSPQRYHERFSQSPRNGHNQLNNGYYHNMWPVHRSIEQEQTHQQNSYDYQPQQQQHDIQGINGYKYRFDNLLVDGKSVHIETIDANDEVNYLSWNERRRRARSESASQDYFYREIYYDDLQDVRVKRTREILKEKRTTTQRSHTTNPKISNFSVLVNNSSHYRHSPKAKIRSHHISHKSGLIRVSSPLHKARLQMWKNQTNNSGSSSVQSTESTSNGDIESQAQPFRDVNQSYKNRESKKGCFSPGNSDDENTLDDNEMTDPDDDPPPISPLDDNEMTDPEDNYESSLSISSSNGSLAQLNNKNPTAINTDCVHGGRVLQGPLAPSLFPFVPPFITFASFEEKGPELPPAIHKILKWKLTTITPLLVRKVLLNTGFRLMKTTDNEKASDAKYESLSEPNDWVGTWGKHMKSPCFKTLHSYQKFNHLPGSFQIGRKDRCWRNLQNLMARHGKKEFGFMPRTFIIPQDLNMLRQTWHRYSQKNTKWIIKPPASARGTGIRVVNCWSQIPKRKPLIVQRYIERPLLINGSKFDLRLYVLVTSLNPLRVYMHTDGLARFASVKYSERTETLNDRYMHLTNYSINKLSTSYDKNDDANACKGMKWTIKSLWSYLQQRGVNTERLWGALRNLVLRTILAGEGPINSMMKTNLQNKYNAFELFGIDVLLDSEMVPWLLEVNISPSLHSASGLDMAVKGPLVTALLNTAMYQIPPKIPIALQGEMSREMNVKMPLCYDKRIYVTTLSKEERQKHHHFTQKTIQREDYLPTILENLTPDDLRCLILTEDELNRCHPLERIFPAPNSYKYLNFTDQPRYYNLLVDAWENRYSKKRDSGIALLRTLCYKRMHLKVPPTTIQKDCGDKSDLEKIAETGEEVVQSMSVDSMESSTKVTETTTSSSCDDIEIDSNENKDTSNLAEATASPKKDMPENGKCFSSIMNCLPITSDSEIILVKQ